MKPTDPKTDQTPPRKGRKSDPKQVNQATGEEFEREGMGIAPKE